MLMQAKSAYRNFATQVYKWDFSVFNHENHAMLNKVLCFVFKPARLCLKKAWHRPINFYYYLEFIWFCEQVQLSLRDIGFFQFG